MGCGAWPLQTTSCSYNKLSERPQNDQHWCFTMPAVANQTVWLLGNILWQWDLFFPGVRFSHNGTTYQNNSLVTLEDIGEDDDDPLLCLTDLTTCCRGSDTPPGTGALGNWFFPNGTAVPNKFIDIINGVDIIWKFYRNRGPSVVRMNRREGGVDGIYRCEISVSLGTPIVYQNIYIGVYTASTGELYMYTGVN